MHRIHRTRIIFAVVLLLASAGLPAWGAELRGREDARPAARLAALARSAAVLFWDRLTGLWEKEGCGLDPHGGCPSQSTAETDEGCGLDPHGGCTAGK